MRSTYSTRMKMQIKSHKIKKLHAHFFQELWEETNPRIKRFFARRGWSAHIYYPDPGQDLYGQAVRQSRKMNYYVTDDMVNRPHDPRVVDETRDTHYHEIWHALNGELMGGQGLLSTITPFVSAIHEDCPQLPDMFIQDHWYNLTGQNIDPAFDQVVTFKNDPKNRRICTDECTADLFAKNMSGMMGGLPTHMKKTNLLFRFFASDCLDDVLDYAEDRDKAGKDIQDTGKKIRDAVTAHLSGETDTLKFESSRPLFNGPCPSAQLQAPQPSA